MKRLVPYWLPEADFSDTDFFIQRMDTSGHVRAAQVPTGRVPLTGFLYLTGGEVLVEAEGDSSLCYPGQLLLIPENMSFAIRYYQDAKGYSGAFSTTILPDARLGARISKVIHHAFWFDEASFVGELFNLLARAFEDGRTERIGKGLDMLLTLAITPESYRENHTVTRFLDRIFTPDAVPGTISDYAREEGVSAGWLSRMVKKETGRSIGVWIELARLTRAKRLLQETDMSVIDVAAAVGLDDQSYFARFFRKHTGMTPTAFRSKMCGKHR